MQEIPGTLGVLILILGMVLLVAIFVLFGKCQILNNNNQILERQVKRMQQKNDGLEERVKAQSLIIQKQNTDIKN